MKTQDTKPARTLVALGSARRETKGSTSGRDHETLMTGLYN